MIDKLNELQHRVMAELEEAGEQEVTGLFITIANDPHLRDPAVDALVDLHRQGLINISTGRDPVTLPVEKFGVGRSGGSN